MLSHKETEPVMTDETRTEPDAQTPEAPESTAVATPPEEQGPKKLRQQVDIKDTGPCKKHIKVSVERDDINERMNDHFSKLVKESNVPGFRPGKTPRKLIEARFHKDVANQVKGEVLLASLEQLGEDFDVAPLAPPQIDPDAIEIPKDGNLVYEFDVEVRPQFDLPEYRKLKIKRPTKTYTAQDVSEARRRFLTQYGQVAPKDNATAELGDILVADMTIRHGERVIGNAQETQLRVEKTLAFKDGIVKRFHDAVKGVKPGETRVVDIELGSNAAGGLGGLTVKGTIEVKDVKTIRLPELTPEFVEQAFGLTSPDQLDEMIKAALERNLEFEQRRQARLQVLNHIAAASTWDLPQDLLERQYRRAQSRRIMEMKGDGLPDAEIAKRIRLMEQDIYTSTALALKEHFVLQKIAEQEDIEVDEKDMEDEIERIADQTGESYRKVRAKLEKDDMMEALMAEMVERKALDLILDSAEYEDVKMADEDGEVDMATVDTQAVPGEMRDPTAEAEAAAKAEAEAAKAEQAK